MKNKKDNKSNIIGIIIAIVVGLLIVGLAITVSVIKDDERTKRKEEVTLETAGFNSISVDEFVELTKKNEKSIVLVARPTCTYCVKFTPILKEAKDDMNLVINYVNTDDFTEEDWPKFEGSLEFFSEVKWGTPLTLIVQKGTVVDYNNGYTELESIKEFFRNNGFGE